MTSFNQHFNASRYQPRKNLSAAIKVVERLGIVSASEIVPTLIAMTLGDVRISGDHYEAKGYGVRAISIRNRTQAVRNWMLAVATEAARAPIEKEACDGAR